MKRVSSKATLVCMLVRTVGRKDESQGTGEGKPTGLCAKNIREASLGLEARVEGS